jgi:uncharacterized protein YjbI with pentapeptide repeats
VIEIRHRYTNAVLFKSETARTLRTALAQAVAAGASLVNARLDGASLVNARLDGASLDGASLVNARLDGASLVNACLDGASLVNARLVNARLDGASLVNARLDGASLVNARLDGASLDGASLDGIKEDLYEVLEAARAEVPGLLAALEAGNIDGSAYRGSCACLVGTLANVRGCEYDEMDGIEPDSSRPAEVWFMAIRPGHTPANSQIAALTKSWILDWMASQEAVTP